jgi:hypothetical protein
MKTIYIAVPYASNPKRGIELSIKYGQMVARQGDVPICPVLLFDPIFSCDDLCEKTHRAFILESCIELLNKCDEVWFIEVNNELSSGQEYELECVIAEVIPFKVIELEA